MLTPEQAATAYTHEDEEDRVVQLVERAIERDRAARAAELETEIAAARAELDAVRAQLAAERARYRPFLPAPFVHIVPASAERLGHGRRVLDLGHGRHALDMLDKLEEIPLRAPPPARINPSRTHVLQAPIDLRTGARGRGR